MTKNMMCNLVQIFTFNVEKPSAVRAFQVIMGGAVTFFVDELKASTLSFLGNVFADKSLPDQFIKMTVNSCLTDRLSVVCEPDDYLIGGGVLWYCRHGFR